MFLEINIKIELTKFRQLKGITMYLNNLVIEVTRRCNLQCDHCLRGNQEQKDINPVYIENVLMQFDSIGSLTFSGGEPFLNPCAISNTLKVLKKRDISLGSFYIATNGTINDIGIVKTCLDMYFHCHEREMCQVALSSDVFHKDQTEISKDDLYLSALTFFTERDSDFDDMNKTDWLIPEGRGMDWYTKRESPAPELYTVESDYGIEDGTIYLNVEGNIIAGCDFSYKSQDEHIICTHLDNIMESITEYVANN